MIIKMRTAPNCLTSYFPSCQGLKFSQLCQQAADQLLPAGLLSVRDWLLPGSRLRGKKANLQNQAGDYLNGLLAFAGVGYGRGLSLPQYQDRLQQNGFVCQHYAIQTQQTNFHDWVAPAKLSAKDTLRLQALIIQAPAPALEYLTPQIAGDRISFQLQEILIIAERTVNSNQ